MKTFKETNPEIKEEINVDEISSTLETVPVLENETLKDETVKSDEYSDTVEEATPRARKSKQQNKSIITLTTSFVTVAVASLLAFTNLINVSLDAHFEDFTFQDGNISYNIVVQDHNDEDLFVYLYNEDNSLITRHEITKESEDGIISDFIVIDPQLIKDSLDKEEDNQLTLHATLRGNVGLDVERTFDNYDIEVTQMVSTFSSVDSHCNCSKDGYFYFQMNFSDDYGVFTDFSAYIIDQEEATFKCNLTEDLHKEQKIYVQNAYGGKAQLIIIYYVDGEEQKITVDIKI